MSTEKQDSEFFNKLQKVLGQGWIKIPDYHGYRGSGAPGIILQELVGIEANNRDGPDSGVWELKYHGGSAPLTLFHLTPSPSGIMHQIVRAYGWQDKKGRISFRHTIWGSSQKGFKVVSDANRITIRHEGIDADPDVIPPYWTHDQILNAFSYKLRRLAVVKGTKRKGQVKYESAHLYWEPNVTSFVEAIEHGAVAIDFDVRTNERGQGLRDHGTKFRVKESDLRLLYAHNRRLTKQ